MRKSIEVMVNFQIIFDEPMRLPSFNQLLSLAFSLLFRLLTVAYAWFSYWLFFILFYINKTKRRIVYVRVFRNNKQALSGEIPIEDYQEALVVYYIIR